MIRETVKKMDQQQLAEALAYLKVMVEGNPTQAQELLTQNPQLAYGVLEALIVMNLVDAYTLQRILQSHPQGYTPGQATLAPTAAAPQLEQQLQEQQKALIKLIIATGHAINQSHT